MSVKVSEVVLDKCVVHIDGCSALKNIGVITLDITLNNVPLKLMIYRDRWSLNFCVQNFTGSNISGWRFRCILATTTGNIELHRICDCCSFIIESELCCAGLFYNKFSMQITVLKYEHYSSQQVARESKSRVNILKLLKDTQFMSDFELLAQDKDGVEQRFKVHKLILAAHSPVFAAMLTSGMEEQTLGVLVISEFSAEVVREVVNFMYEDELLVGVVDLSHSLNMLRFACMYQMSDLEVDCVAYVIANMTKENVLETLQFASLLGCSHLKQAMIDFIKHHFDRLDMLYLMKLPCDLREEVISAMGGKLCN